MVILDVQRTKTLASTPKRQCVMHTRYNRAGLGPGARAAALPATREYPTSGPHPAPQTMAEALARIRAGVLVRKRVHPLRVLQSLPEEPLPLMAPGLTASDVVFI